MTNNSWWGRQWPVIGALGAMLVAGCAAEMTGSAEPAAGAASPGSASQGPSRPDPSLPNTEDPDQEDSESVPEDVSLDGIDPCVFTPKDLDWFTEFDEGGVIESGEGVESCRYQPVADEHPLIEVVLYTDEGFDREEVDSERAGTIDINGRETSVLEGLLADGRLIVRMTMEMSDTAKASLHYIASEPESEAEAAQASRKLKDLARMLESRLTS